jgi:hypothetical protein
MSDADNEDFGRVALRLGLCTRSQVERCLRIQSSTDERLSLGQSLLREGFLSEGQFSRVLETQRADARKRAAVPPFDGGPPALPGSPQNHGDDLLGKLAVREGWITERKVRACLRAANAGAAPRPLLEVMVDRGHLDPAGAEALKARLSKRPMSCSACSASFTVLSLARSAIVPCPRCRRPLAQGFLVPGRRAADLHATRVLQEALSTSIKPSSRPPGPPTRNL